MGETLTEVYRALRDTREDGYGCISVGFTVEFVGVHEVFHVSMLQKYIPDPTHVMD